MKFIFIPIALLIGVAVFVLLLMVVKGGYFATKRRKTKLGLVKVAGAGLKLDDDELEDEDSGEPSVAKESVRVTATAAIDTDDKVSANAGAAVAVDNGEAGIAVATGATAIGAVSGESDNCGENTECEETLAVPLESIDDESGAEAPSKPLSLGGDKPGSIAAGAVHRSESRPFGEKSHTLDDNPVVRKIVEEPIENPFLNGRLSASGDAHGKKTTSQQRRRLPETVKMKDRKVILAEDVAINRDLIAMYFEGSGVKFEFAVNGREVCEKFERDPSSYSLILMDIQMPEMDGYEVSRRIRAMDVDWAKQIPIIAMTGNDQKEDIDLCFEAGMDDHIPKPIDMEVLQEKVFDIITLNTENF